MTRSLFTPLVATTQVIILVVGVPVWAIVRLTDPVLPTQTLDLALIMALVLWGLMIKALIERTSAIDSVSLGRQSAMWNFHRVVDQSLFGAGLLDDTQEQLALAHAVHQPTVITASDLPAELPRTQLERHDESADLPATRSVPVLHSVEPEAPVILATETYTVGRGDSYWSIAEATLGDGRAWQAIQDLNVGREVAPGVVLTASGQREDLRIGWSIPVSYTHLTLPTTPYV